MVVFKIAESVEKDFDCFDTFNLPCLFLNPKIFNYFNELKISLILSISLPKDTASPLHILVMICGISYNQYTYMYAEVCF